ncbi:hypothetical protein RA27_18135 [Ruegeria sp. ANG-R]|uniref:NAD-dependent epimerase/dehydratase family protein n=1 Tax=Ruegeria sp. ANG-R TaxID=1577903 RepID=UPI00058049B7|nr:NAD-dependent epimerase/dehydratase family protein [Ruegeria sp. ANG-R]KIC39064.1 hypothetical protein RA27_18135 [Ruegeria sp. ANG-R]
MLEPRNIGILGSTGFVGSTIARSFTTAQGFNSRTVGEAENANFETLYCAAAPGSMFEANRYPERDAKRIDALIASISRMHTERFVLISTIAVLDAFDAGRTETDHRYQETTPYGVNRRRLEAACHAHFPRCLVVRLPALFGPGLAKNFIFDLINPMPTMLNEKAYQTLQSGLSASLLPSLETIYALDTTLGMYVINRAALSTQPDGEALTAEADQLGINAMMFHNRETTFQFYDMSRLVDDIDLALGAGLDVLHLAPAPLKTSGIYSALKGHEMPETHGRVHNEDMRTLHAQLWGRNGPYMNRPEDVLDTLTPFFNAELER